VKAARNRKVKVGVVRVHAAREKLRRRLRTDPNAFIQFAFRDQNGTPMVQAYFHREWQTLWSDEAFALIVAPRNHGKTTQLMARVVWELGKNPNLRIKIVCQSDKKAKERLYEIQQALESNPRVRWVFPELRPADKGEWSKHAFYVQRTGQARDPSVEAAGVLSSATGGRADLIIYDDIVDRRNALQFPRLRIQVTQSYRDDWTNLLEPDGRSWYICTLWHKEDLTHELIREGSYAVKRYAINANMDPIWPKVWPREKLKQRRNKIGRIAFDRGFRNIPLSGDLVMVDPDWVHFEPIERMPDNLLTVVAFDLAISKKTRADYFAWCVLGLSRKKRKIYVLDAGRRKLTFLKQARMVVEQWRKWNASWVVIETIGYQEALAQYLDDTVIMPVHGFKPKTDKEARLEAVTPYMETGRVLFASHLDPDAEDSVVSMVKGDLVTELMEFPLYGTDDMVDAFTEGVHAIMEKYQEVVADAQDEADERAGRYMRDEREIDMEFHAF